MEIENFEQLKALLQALIVFKKDTLSFKEALIYMDVSSSYLYKLTSKGSIIFSKPTKGKLYFKRSVLDNWMLQNESEGIGVLQNEIDVFLKRN